MEKPMAEGAKEVTDRRQHPRFFVEQGSFAIFQNNLSVLPGLIVDISQSGLAFFYLEGENWPERMEEKYNLFGDDFHVEEICVEKINDIEVAQDYHPLCQTLAQRSPGPCKVRRRGLKFKKLSGEQQEKLAAFITKFLDSVAAK
jgi:hypothetical protein